MSNQVRPPQRRYRPRPRLLPQRSDRGGASAPIDDGDLGANDLQRSAHQPVHAYSHQCAEHCGTNDRADLSGPNHDRGTVDHPGGALARRRSNDGWCTTAVELASQTQT